MKTLKDYLKDIQSAGEEAKSNGLCVGFILQVKQKPIMTTFDANQRLRQLDWNSEWDPSEGIQVFFMRMKKRKRYPTSEAAIRARNHKWWWQKIWRRVWK